MIYNPPTNLAGSVSGLNATLTWTPPTLIDAPRLLLHLDGSMNDSSGSGLNGTVGASCPFVSSPAKFNQALSLPGTGAFGPTKLAYTAISAAGPIDLSIVPEWTVEGWIYLNAVNSIQNLLWMTADVNLTNGIALDCDGFGGLAFSIYGATTGTAQRPTVAGVVQGAWHHVAMTKQLDPLGSGYDLYQLFVDGVGSGPTGTTPGYSGPYAPWTGYLSLNGYWYPALGEFLGGQSQGICWDEIRITANCLYSANFTPPAAPFGTPIGYDVYRDGVSIATFTGGPSYTDTVPAGGIYTYNVAAWDGSADISGLSDPLVLNVSAPVIRAYGKFAGSAAYPPVLLIDAKGIKPRIWMPKENVTVKT